MAEYPKRSSYFANRLIRLLQKSCAANDIGVEACWLVTCVALVEDSKRYTGPVTFWTGQLLPITGFQSWGRLSRSRDRAVEAGWLHYIPGTNRQCARYWTLIPEAVATTFDDSPVDEVDHQNDDSLKINHQNGAPNVIETKITRRLKRGSFIPNPKPNPISCPNRFTDSDMETAKFLLSLILEMQPDRKRPNLDKWADIIRLMRERDNRTDAQIRELFTWCNQDSFWRTNVLSPDKLRQKWDDLQLRRGEGVPVATGTDDWQAVLDIVRTKYSPDLRNTVDVQAALTPEQFTAAQSVGLRRIANADKFDKETPAAYRTARKAVT